LKNFRENWAPIRHSNKKSELTLWRTEELYFESDAYFLDILKDIKSAKRSIYIESHIFDNKWLGRKVTLDLIDALRRGVEVKLLVDGYGAYECYPKKWFNVLESNGAKVTIFNPMPWMKGLFGSIFRLNTRLHKKLWIIDRKVAYMGSLNIDTRHMSEKYGGEGWRDTGIRVTGGRIGLLIASFERDWNLSTGYSFEDENDSMFFQEKIRLNHSPALRYYSNQVFLRRLRRAKNRIWLTNPYFVPTRKILNALKKAAKRGVDVRVIVPSVSDLKWFPLVNSLYYRSLIREGIMIYEYNPSILHAKVCIVDNWASLGSSNLNSRSIKHDFEIDVEIGDPENFDALVKQFHRDIFHSSLVKKSTLFKKFKSRQKFGFVYKVLSYWL
jgi:cardiolipin synthase